MFFSWTKRYLTQTGGTGRRGTATQSAASWLLILLLLICIQFGSADQKNITAKPGDNVTLPCAAATNDSVDVAEWIRIDLKPDHVILYRSKQFDPEGQSPSFIDRVTLQDVDHGNVSLILKNVTTNDTGIYECRVSETESNRTKRSNLDVDPISTVNLTVKPDQTHTWSYSAEIKNRGRKYERKKGEEMDGGNQDGKKYVNVAALVLLVVIVFGIVFMVILIIFKRSSSRPEAGPASSMS